jgi:hypothetical protein
MTLPSTDIKMSDIWDEANTGSVPTISVDDLFKKSYFEGLNGSGTISYNAWGQYGNTSGANVIYNVSSKNTDNAWTDFSLKTYFYDNSTYLIGVNVNNTMPIPGGLDNNDVTIYLTLFDSTMSYSYAFIPGGSGLFCAAQAGSSSQVISTTSTPIIGTGYWMLNIQTYQWSPQMYVDMSINSNLHISNVAISAPNAYDSFDSTVYGTEYVNYYSGFYTGTGLFFDILIHQ